VILDSGYGGSGTVSLTLRLFSGLYGFAPHACTPRAAHQKGTVERPIGCVKATSGRAGTSSTSPMSCVRAPT